MCPGYLNHYQSGRAGREKRLRPEFCEVVNKKLRNFKFELYQQGADYQVLKEKEIVAYFEAEFPDEGRWPMGGDFKYETIRWPLRKWEQYCKKGDGLYNGKPLFMTSIRGDLKDAYYIDALTWCQKSQIEKFRDNVFRGFPKTYPELGKGLEQLEEYMLSRFQKVYGVKI